MLLGLSPIRRQQSDNTHLPQRESTAMNITRTKTARHAAAAVAALLIAAGCGSDTADTPEATDQPATAETPAPTLRDVAETAATTAPPTPADTPSADADPAQTSPQDIEQDAAQEPSGTDPSTEAVPEPVPDPVSEPVSVPEPVEGAVEYLTDEPPSDNLYALYEWQPPQAQRVPAVHPDTAMTSWITGQPHDPPEGLPEVPLVGFRHRDNPGGELPRATPGVLEWAQWCTQGPAVSYDTIDAGSCGLMLNKMVWALDYMGAEESCVLDQYRQKMQWLAETGGGDGTAKPYGWHLCATVIDPAPPNTAPFAQRCEQVLPADVELETKPVIFVDDTGTLTATERQRGVTCQQWAESLYAPPDAPLFACVASGLLAAQWMQHYHDAPTHIEFYVDC